MHEVHLLCEYSTINGGEQSMLSTLEGVYAAGFVPVVMCPHTGPLPTLLRARGVEIVSFECCRADGVRRPYDKLRELLARALRTRRPALLHANSLSMGRLSGPVAASQHVPSLSHVRDIVGLSNQAMSDVNQHTRLLAVSRAVRQFHVAQGATPDKIHILYNGVNLAQFEPRASSGWLHRELGLPEGTILVGTIGQLGLRKGQDVLLQAAQRLADRLPHVHYLLIGERYSNKDESLHYEANLHKAAGGALHGRVHFLGYRHDIDRVMNELAFLVHPARQEPLGRVLLEAGASGLPVIATDVGGTREIFPETCEAARFFAPTDVEGLAEAVFALASDESLRHRMGAAGRERMKEQFDIDIAVRGLLEHYHAIL